jgi:hypothetical protein
MQSLYILSVIIFTLSELGVILRWHIWGLVGLNGMSRLYIARM